MTGKKGPAVAGFMFRFLLFLCLFVAAYVIFVLLGDVVGVFSFFPDIRSAEPVSDERNAPDFIIDPGHGGIDGGAVGVNGVLEKDVNLAVALKVGRFLSLCGAEVVYTRDSDVLLSSSRAATRKSGDVLARVEVARSFPDAVFVSIHANKFPQSSCRGLQVFYSGGDPESVSLADAIQSDVRLWLQPDNDRESADCGSRIYVLDRIDNPAVLIECGFLSNPGEAALLCDEAYQNRLAFVIAHSLMRSAGVGGNQ